MDNMSKIANRGLKLMQDAGYTALKKLDLMMDLEYTNEVHALDFEKLLAFDDGNFAHDIVGIYENFNRETLQLDNCFSPRCSKPVMTAQSYAEQNGRSMENVRR
jgi:hypothetical protein